VFGGNVFLTNNNILGRRILSRGEHQIF